MKIKTLADLAGVSPSTVSKAFSGSHEVSEATRERIFALAREHGVFDKYDKNKFSKRVIAVICPDMRRDYYNEVVNALKKELEARDCMTLVSISDFSPEKRNELYSYYTAYAKVDGVIVLSHTLGDVDPETLMIPTVLYTKNPMLASNVDSIFLDIHPAIVNAISHLQSMGHHRIGFVGHKRAEHRRGEFLRAMHQLHIPLRESDIKMSKENFEKAGAEAIREWLAEGDAPTAIIAAYDYVAIGIMRALKEDGYRVPEDFAVIGMDNIPRAAYLTPSLSSIGFPTEKACSLTIDLLMKKLNDRYYSSPDDIKLEAEFICRESSSAPVSRKQS